MSEEKFVFLITIDDLRKDKLGVYGERPSPTPFLDSFASEGSYMRNHFSIAPSSPTSFRSLFSSTYPMQFRDYSYISDDRPYLPEILSQVGIKTVGFTSNPYISESFGFDQGFEYFFDYMAGKEDEKESKKTEFKNLIKRGLKNYPNLLSIAKSAQKFISGPHMPYPEAEQIVDDFKNFSRNEKLKSSTFFWIHFMEPHSPLIPPKRTYGEYNSLKVKRRKLNDVVREGNIEHMDISQENICALYKECVKSLDINLKELIRFIEDFYGEKNTEIIITSDHGELLGEYGEVGHPEKLREELFEVPFLTKISGNIEAEGVTSHLDVLPTIMDLFDVSEEVDLSREKLFQGENLLENPKRENLVVEAIDADEDGIERVYMTSEIGIISGNGFQRKENYFDIKKLKDEDKIKRHVRSLHAEDWKKY